MPSNICQQLHRALCVIATRARRHLRNQIVHALRQFLFAHEPVHQPHFPRPLRRHHLAGQHLLERQLRPQDVRQHRRSQARRLLLPAVVVIFGAMSGVYYWGTASPVTAMLVCYALEARSRWWADPKVIR